MEATKSICGEKADFLLAMGSLLFVGRVGVEVEVEANRRGDEANGRGNKEEARIARVSTIDFYFIVYK